MLSRTCLTKSLLLAASLALAPSCATRAPTRPLFPPAADLQDVPKPRLDPTALGSQAALDDHDTAVEAWGEEGWARIGRICRWAVANNAPLPFDCPKAGE